MAGLVPSEGCGGESPPCFSPGFCGLSCSWLVAGSFGVFPWTSLCACLCVQVPSFLLLLRLFYWCVVDAECYVSFNIVIRCTSHHAHHKQRSHPSPYNTMTVLLTLFPMLYSSSSWLTPSVTRSLHLPLPFTYFALLSPPHPAAMETTTSSFSIFMGLFLLFLFVNLLCFLGSIHK